MPNGCSCYKVFTTDMSVENLTGQRSQLDVREWSGNYQGSYELESIVIYLNG